MLKAENNQVNHATLIAKLNEKPSKVEVRNIKMMMHTTTKKVNIY